MKRRIALVGVLLSAVTAAAFGYNIPNYSYDDMFAKSDLVVIARPSKSRDTGERKLDRNFNPPVSVAGVITECDALYVLKGRKLKRFAFHHYRDVTRYPSNAIVIGSPTGISFDSHKGIKYYLMFLVREAGGRFAPAAGQTDVERISVQELAGSTGD